MLRARALAVLIASASVVQPGCGGPSATGGERAAPARPAPDGSSGGQAARSRWRGPRPEAIYFVLVDRFADGPDPDDDADPGDPQGWHGGDLEGARRRLDHIADLGFSAIWLSPVFETRDEKFHGHGAFHGYWTTDLGAIDDRFGGEKALRALGSAVAERGMGLYLDVVLNHVGYESKLVTERPSWFHRRGTITDWNERYQLENHDVHGLPDLDQNNPAVFQYLLESSARWLDVPGVIGFRLDAVKHVSASFWTRYNREIHRRAGEGHRMLGELFDGSLRPMVAALRDQGFDQLFDFPLYFAMRQGFCAEDGVTARSLQGLAATLSLDRLYPDPNQLVTFADNHDLPRLWSLCQTPERVHRLLTFQLLSRGVPMLTYGTEVGLRGENEPENRADMRFPERPTPTMELVRSLLRARVQHPALARGETRVTRADDDALILERSAGGECATIAVVAKGATPVQLPAGSSRYGDVDDQRRVPGGGVGASVAPKSCPWQPRRDVVVRFQLAYTGEHPPSQVVVAGAGPELGSWDPSRAPRFRDGGVEVVVPSGTALVYKLAVVTPLGTAWEKGGNHFLFTGDGGAEVEVSWRD